MFRRLAGEKTGTVILDGIGSTEALHIFIGQPAGRITGPAPAAKPVPGYEVCASSTRNGKPVPKGEGAGRLWIRGRLGRQILLEHKPEKDGRGPWSAAGSTPADTYREDPDGYLIYDGRSDDMLKVGGILVLAGRDRETA